MSTTEPRLRIEVPDQMYVIDFVSLMSEYAIAYTSVQFIISSGHNRPELFNAMRFNLAPFIALDEQPRLGRVNINSPGFWEMIGSWNPLKVMVDYMRHRDILKHERRFDSETQREQELRNVLLENQVIRERVEILQSLGFTKTDQRNIVQRYLEGPLTRAANATDQLGIKPPDLIV